jgi:hypothetical protein
MLYVDCGVCQEEAINYPLVNCYITMERSTIFHGKIHYFDWAIFNSELLNYQRVNTKVSAFCRSADILVWLFYSRKE